MIFADPLALVDFARRRCPYYRDLYRELPDDVRWAEVPLLDPERYWAAKADDLAVLLTHQPPDGYIWTTGGSTSRGRRVAVSSEDFREEHRVFGRALLAAGLAAGDRVANLTWAGELSASFLLTNATLHELPVLQLPILGMTSPARTAELCRELRSNVLVGFPTVLFRLANFLNGQGERLPIDKILYAGEPLHGDQKEALASAFGARHVAPFGYAAVDCGPIGAPALELGEDVYRPLAGYTWVEIVDAEGRPAREGEIGRIVITNLGRALSPVIRYPLGDLASWVVAPDAEGRGGAFRLHGRAYLSVKINMRIVGHREIVESAAATAGLSSAVQLVVSRRGGLDHLTVRVAPTVSGEAAERARAALLSRLCAAYPFLHEGHDGERGPLIAVELCASERMAVTVAGKVKPIVMEDRTS